MRELRQVLGDAYAVGGAEQPPLKYLLCRANDLADVTTRTQAVSRLPGVESVRVTLNRELLVGNEFVHSLVRERIQQWGEVAKAVMALGLFCLARCGTGPRPGC